MPRLDAVADRDDAFCATPWGLFVEAVERQIVGAVLDPHLRERVVDVGCGTGTSARWLADAGCTGVRVDESPAMLAMDSIKYDRGRLCKRMETTAMVRRALRLEWMSIGWMVIEAAGALWAGVHARSVALTGFGADSLIELLSASILVQRLTVQVRGGDADTVEAAEHRAARWAAALLGLLALYLIGAAAWELFGHLREAPSPLGIVLAAVSVGLMFWIARTKRALGRALGSVALQADAAESVVCAWMAATALISLVANWAFHWTWVDPLAALLIAYWVAREAREAWEEAHEEQKG